MEPHKAQVSRPTVRRIVIASALLLLCISIAVFFRAYKQHVSEKRNIAAAQSARLRAEQGDAGAEFELAHMYYKGKGVPQSYTDAVQWYTKAAEQGYAKAQFNLGKMYYEGKGVRQDYGEGIRWYRQAAGLNDVRAQLSLGYAYYHGEGVQQDYAQAVDWYKKAADAGDPFGQEYLGYMYSHGQGVTQDDAQAVAWYRRAAEQSNAGAERSLGYMYANGRGVPRDRIEAVRWYRKAAENGDPEARHFVESLSKPPLVTRYVLGTLAVIGLLSGLVFSVDFLRHRNIRDWRWASTGVLAVVLLAYSALSAYAFIHDLRYSPYHDLFVMVRRLLGATAVLIIVTVVLRGKRSQTSETSMSP